jgi:transposase-like protein
MGQLLHGSARTTAAVRRAIQHSQESLAKLAKRHGLDPKTVAKWKKRSHVHDAPMGPKPCHSTVLTLEEDALMVTFRRHTRLPLDDCLDALQATLPHLTRAALHRGLQRHGISRLPAMAGEKPAQKKFKPAPLGDCHLDIAAVRTEEGRLSLLVAIARTCTCAYAERQAEAHQMVVAECLRHVIAAGPDKIHTVLTEHGLQFTNRKRDQYAFQPSFDRLWHDYGIDHRLTKPNHPWSNGQVERMNRTLKEATVKKYSYQSHHHLKAHGQAFLMAYNFAKRLKTLKGLTPYEYICSFWQKEPERFDLNPHRHTLGLNT